MVPASHILMCHRERQGLRPIQKGGRKKKKKGSIADQTASCSQQ